MKSSTLRALALCSLPALGLITCTSPDGGQAGGGILRTGGDIASILTGDERFSQLGEATARSIRDADDFRPSEEHYIGRSVGASVLGDRQFPLLGNQAITDYVNMIGLAIAYSSDAVRQTFKGYHFAVVRSTELNAFAAPGGFIFITSGMLLQTANEEELAGILAHEIAHVTLKHGLEAIPQTDLVEAGGLLTELYAAHGTKSKKDGRKFTKSLNQLSELFGQSVDKVVFTLLSGGYGADKEFAADELGARLVREAGYAPNAIQSFLGHMPTNTTAGGWLSTHPEASARAAKLGNAAGSAEGMELRKQRHERMIAQLAH